MLDELRRQSDTISLEAAAGADSLNTAKEKLAGFFSDVKGFLSKHLLEPVKNLFADNGIGPFAKRMQKTTYAEIRPIAVVVPAGLSSDLVTYAQALVKSAEATKDLVNDVVGPFQSWVRSKLGNPSSLASLTSSLNISGLRPHKVEELEKLLQSCFHGGNGTQPVNVPYGQAIKRNQDWYALNDAISRISAAYNDKTHGEIVRQVQDLMEDINTLMTRLKEDPATYAVSGITVQLLSQTTHMVAREVEFYGLLRHRITEFQTSVQATREKLEKLLDEQQ
jgi:hypothetical protein